MTETFIGWIAILARNPAGIWINGIEQLGVGCALALAFGAGLLAFVRRPPEP
jgi:hypothetical protein